MPSQREEITESCDLMALVQYIYKSFLYFLRFYTLVNEGKLDLITLDWSRLIVLYISCVL